MKKVNDSQNNAEPFTSVAIPAGKYWGMQTQLTLTNFNIGNERFPRPFITYPTTKHNLVYGRF